MQNTRKDIKVRIQKMLAAALQVDESVLTDDFPWFRSLGGEAAEDFMADINDAFTTVPPGFSFGDGRHPFRGFIDADTSEQIETVGGLVTYIARYVTRLHS